MFADVCQRPVSIYAGRETITCVLYALCQSHLGVANFERNLGSTFDKSTTFLSRKEVSRVYDEAYRGYRSFAMYAAEQARASMRA